MEAVLGPVDAYDVVGFPGGALREPIRAGDVLVRVDGGSGGRPLVARMTAPGLHGADVFPPGAEAEGDGDGLYAEALERTPAGWARAPAFQIVANRYGIVQPGRIVLRPTRGALRPRILLPPPRPAVAVPAPVPVAPPPAAATDEPASVEPWPPDDDTGDDREDAPTVQAGRSTTLPLLLAGPIVRRAEREGVWFWFASSEEVTACRPKLTIYERDGKVVDRLTDQAGFYRLGPPEWRVTRLGEHLWVVLAVARPRSDVFPVDWIYGYDLEIEYRAGAQRQTVNLSSLGLPITYRPFALPTFMIARRNRRLVQGSCRRPGAPGPDAFLAYDRWLSQRIQDVEQRPSALLLTGDQIYADDVAAPLFKALHKLAADVCGWVEHLPRVGAQPLLVDAYLWGTSWPYGTRKGLTSIGHSPIGFTTDEGESHLLSFPEYAAMYLATWNETLCKSYGVEDRTDENLVGFTKAVAAARRVLANHATYMVFDDHEITDDWNLDADWEKATRNPTAQRIIANGLAAYWAFQGWGNDPDAFDPAFVGAVERHLEAMRSARGIPGAAAAAFDTTLLGRHWSFVAPTSPPALCVDTRTSRETKPGETATLSGRRAWSPYLEALAQRHKLEKGKPLLLVLPTPFLAHRSIYTAQKKEYPWPEKRYQGDWELYVDNPGQRPDLILFLKKLLDPPALVIFSGDVHFGFAVDGLYVHGKDLDQIYEGHGDWAMRIAQVTSSPIKNIKKEAFVDPNWHTLWLTDAGNAGETLISQFENRYKKVSDGVIALRFDVRKLKGQLGRETFIWENHLCVVDVPEMAPDRVEVLFIGEKQGQLATATTAMGIDNSPSKFKPPVPYVPVTPKQIVSGVAPIVPIVSGLLEEEADAEAAYGGGPADWLLESGVARLAPRRARYRGRTD
ncbi:MAG TPA: hypothetical protein VIV57_08300 [Anaeromyxobacter sp.]